MITKQSTVNQIEITENNIIQVRTVTRIIEDGKILNQTFHRHCLSPGDALSDQDEKVIAVAKIVWIKTAEHL